MPHKEEYDTYPYVIVAKSAGGVLWYWSEADNGWIRNPDKATGWRAKKYAGDVLIGLPSARCPNARVADIRCTSGQLGKLVIERTMPDQSVWYLKIYKSRWTRAKMIHHINVTWTSNINDASDHSSWDEDAMLVRKSWLKSLYGDAAALVRKS